MSIPAFLDRDDYLQNPVMRRFLKNHKIDLVENRADYINAIEAYASQNAECKAETDNWLLKVAKEGSKEICFRKIYKIEDWCRDPALVEAKIREAYPDCPNQNILTYRNTGDRTMIGYQVLINDNGEVYKLEFTFSNLFYYGEVGEQGNTTVFPVFVEVYLDSGFVVSRAKAKSTLFKYDPNNAYLDNKFKIDTSDYAVSAIDEIVGLFTLETITTSRIVKHENAAMLYNLYQKYSFSPEDVVEKVASQQELVNAFVDGIFANLSLDVRNKERALLDAQIFVEKFISINGNNEDIFKQDRPAYLIKVTADDEIELTKIDTTSAKTVPLQCTEAFFDSKKSVIKSQKCKRLNLIFKRTDETYFGKNNPLVVQLGTHKDHGYLKTMQYAEEADIQNVLHAIFENY